jgi:hypothetical protein
MKMKLQSLLVSEESLFLLMQDGDRLTIRQEKFDDVIDTPCVMRSGQPRMLIPDSERNITVCMDRETIYIRHSDKEDSFIASSTDGDWAFFFLNLTPKILIHVQPKVEQFNFKEYKHEVVTDSADEMLAKLDERLKLDKESMDEYMKEIDKIAQEVEKMESSGQY